ncbi:hypothetical protein DB346_19055 [Verrucomicrobia bacterium LW23]|nr:hypothetical protein DB346_19055 [Verrucomicrobia bacterium LW23]
MQGFGLFFIVSFLFGIYIILWFLWTMYRITTLRQSLNWVDAAHLGGLIAYMVMLQMVRQDMMSGIPPLVPPAEVARAVPIRLEGTGTAVATRFMADGVTCYALLVEVPAAQYNAFLAANAESVGLKPGQTVKADERMTRFLDTFMQLAPAFGAPGKVDKKLPAYTPFRHNFGDGMIFPLSPAPGATEPGIYRVYFRIADVPEPAPATTPPTNAPAPTSPVPPG